MLTNHVKIGPQGGFGLRCLKQHILFFLYTHLIKILIVTVVIWVAWVEHLAYMKWLHGFDILTLTLFLLSINIGRLGFNRIVHRHLFSSLIKESCQLALASLRLLDFRSLPPFLFLLHDLGEWASCSLRALKKQWAFRLIPRTIRTKEIV